MKDRIFEILLLVWLTACCVSASGKCKLLPVEDERSLAYSCVEATYDDVKDISNQATEIQFTVSVLNIPERAFADFSLRKLSFLNCRLRGVDPRAFEGLSNLEELTIFDSDIRVLRPTWFKGLHKLRSLSLKKNKLVYIEPKTFLEIPKLQHLDLENNDLDCLAVNALATLRHLKHFRMEKNPWLCSCHEELVSWLLKNEIDLGMKSAKRMRFECMVESRNEILVGVYRNSSVQGVGFYGNASEDTTCDYKTLPILWPSPDNTGSITVSGVNITTIPEFAFFQFGNSLRSLNLSDCGITEIHPKAFAGLPKLEQLILFNNRISTVKADWFADLRSLKVLVLDRNGVKHIESHVFPLLDKLEYLSLEQNAIECLSTDTFGMMRQLKRVNIAKNPWNCGCFNNFRSWLDKHRIAYRMFLGSCTNGNIQENGGGWQGSEYWSSSNHSESFSSSFNSSQYHDDVYNKFENYFRENSENMMHGGERQRNKKSVSNGHHPISREERQIQYNGQGCPRVDVCQPRCEIVGMQPCTRCHYECSGGSILQLNEGWHGVLDTAESIQFKDSRISVISNYAFRRFGGTLRALKFINCKIQTIEPQAFAGLYNLQELHLSDNNIREVQASWFESTTHLQRLILTHNHIKIIENRVFQHLPNLEHLGISDNQLNCIPINSLDYMSRLRWMDVDNNPWSCLCRNKLIEWMRGRNVHYNINFWREYPYIECEDPSWTIPTSPPVQPPYTKLTTSTTTDNPPYYTKLTTSTTTYNPPPYIKLTTSTTTDNPRPGPQGQCSVTNRPNSFRCTSISGNRFDLDQIPDYAERIEINSVKLYLNSDAFARFKNLKELLIYNCSIEYIDDSAFRGLNNLKLLVFQGNNIPTINSAWFDDLTALTELDMSGNHVMEIEGDVFKYLSNLRVLSLQNNDIQCIYTKSLDSLKNLNRIAIQNNPLKWRCNEGLREFLDARRIKYTDFGIFGGKPIACSLKEPLPVDKNAGMTNTSISSVNVLCISIAMLIFTKF